MNAVPNGTRLPVTPLGARNGAYRIRSAGGVEWTLTRDELEDPYRLVALFGSPRWLREQFPARFVSLVRQEGGHALVPMGFAAPFAADHLAGLCEAAERQTEARREIARSYELPFFRWARGLFPKWRAAS